MHRLAISLILLALAGTVIADTTITYQGQLRQAGVPHSGTANLEFRLFDELTGGNQIGDAQEHLGWPVEDGLFQVDLDFGAGAFDGSPRFLEVTVNDTVLSPRQAIRPVPMALHAPSGSGSGSPFTLDPDTGTIEYLFDDQVIRFEPMPGSYGWVSPAITLGSAANVASWEGAVVSGSGDPSHPNRALGLFATVGGGIGNLAGWDHSAVGGGIDNTASHWNSTVGGGSMNTASSRDSTVGGGSSNTASGEYSTVVGGWGNSASGFGSTVGGGRFNCAGGDYSWAGGRRAMVRPATDPGTGACSGLTYPGGNGDEATFVWADSTQENFVSTGPDQFLVRAAGGVGINTNSPARMLHMRGGASNTPTMLFESEDAPEDQKIAALFMNVSSGHMSIGRMTDDGASLATTHLQIRADNGYVGLSRTSITHPLHMASGAHVTAGGTWTNASSRELKTGFEAIDAASILQRVVALPLTRWRYRNSLAEGTHLGPIAEDFHAAFGLGGDDKTISSVDASGVAFAAIQALNEKLETENAELRARLDRLEALFLELAEKPGIKQ